MKTLSFLLIYSINTFKTGLFGLESKVQPLFLQCAKSCNIDINDVK